MQHSTGYIVGFAIAVCLVCALFVAGSAVGLKERQEANILLDRQKKVLTVAGLMKEGEKLSREEIAALFESSIKPKVIDLETGEIDPSIDPTTFDQQAEARDPETSVEAPENASKIRRLPKHALVYDVVQNGKLKALILPVEGYGLWGTLYGYIAWHRTRGRSRESPSTNTRKPRGSAARSTIRAGRRSGTVDSHSTSGATP